MEDLVESAYGAGRDCVYLSEKIRLPMARLEAIIPRVNSQWRGVSGEEFAAGLRQISEKLESTEQKLLALAERIEREANNLSAEF